MKRRDFLAASALLSLFAGEAAAAPQKKASTTKKKTTAAKPKRSTSTRSSRNAVQQPSRPPVHSAATPLIDHPPEGTSASRLPPVRAPELPSEWRTYEIVTTLTLKAAGQSLRFWLPLPASQDSLYQRNLGYSWQGNPDNASIVRRPDGQLEALHCEWRDAASASLRLVTHVSTADRHFDITRRSVAPDRDDILRHNLQASTLIPNDGLAKQLGERIVGRIKDPVAQVKAIYDWICDNTIYDPSLPGCGNGNVHNQLISGQYGGRSADINGLFVAICRSIGIPARCVYGLRIAPSRLFRSLGLRSNDATQAQHVRAEFYLPGYGWIPADPSDVRRAASYELLQEQDSRLASLKRVLFGVWEMNWVACHVGNDLELPGQSGRRPFFVIPEIEINGKIQEERHPAQMPYAISARQIEL